MIQEVQQAVAVEVEVEVDLAVAAVLADITDISV